MIKFGFTSWEKNVRCGKGSRLSIKGRSLLQPECASSQFKSGDLKWWIKIQEIRINEYLAPSRKAIKIFWATRLRRYKPIYPNGHEIKRLVSISCNKLVAFSSDVTFFNLSKTSKRLWSLKNELKSQNSPPLARPGEGEQHFAKKISRISKRLWSLKSSLRWGKKTKLATSYSNPP